jgi:hypothetical protein
MPNLLFELDKLRMTLRNKGLDDGTIEAIVAKANNEINQTMREQTEAAMQLAIESGVQKESADFINDLRLDAGMMQLITESGNMNFPEPPKPMLPQLLKNAKPTKDGTAVYKVIPVGSPGKDKPKVSMNVYDSWKQLNAERIENAQRQYRAVAPKESKFRTASSRQDPNTKWVKPGKENDFSEEVRNINKELENTMERLIQDIIRSYEEGF